MEGRLRQLGGIENIKIDVETKQVRFNFDAKKHSLQELLKAIEGESGRFSARLLLQFKSKNITEEDFLKLKNALVRIKGVRSVGEPDKSRTVMITLKKEERTFLQEILDNSEKAGISLQNPIKDEKSTVCSFGIEFFANLNKLKGESHENKNDHSRNSNAISNFIRLCSRFAILEREAKQTRPVENMEHQS